MKNKILIYLISSLAFLSCTHHDARSILKAAFNKCQSVQNGYYEMTRYEKFLQDTDTTVFKLQCHFKRLTNDTIYNCSFHYDEAFNDPDDNFKMYRRSAIYTGHDFASLSLQDSTAVIMPGKLWLDEIKSESNSFRALLYTPFTDKNSYPLSGDADNKNNNFNYNFIGEEIINNIRCYHLQVNEIPLKDPENFIQTMYTSRDYWISREDDLPLQYSESYTFLMNNDTTCQYSKYTLTKYIINTPEDETILSLNSIPAFYKSSYYVPHKTLLCGQKPDRLMTDTLAPDWSLYSLDKEKISLKKYRRQLVLLDFFYKGCAPCIESMPFLERLNKKYSGKGLKVIGIDLLDKPEELRGFLKIHPVDYTVVRGSEAVVRDYLVSGYPTLYLINKNGKIIYVQVGYNESTEEKLEGIIIKNL